MLKTKVKRIEKLKKAVSGVKLTQEEEKTLMWLSEWEDSSVDNIVSIIEKVRCLSDRTK